VGESAKPLPIKGNGLFQIKPVLKPPKRLGESSDDETVGTTVGYRKPQVSITFQTEPDEKNMIMKQDADSSIKLPETSKPIRNVETPTKIPNGNANAATKHTRSRNAEKNVTSGANNETLSENQTRASAYMTAKASEKVARP
jgi:type IV secretory pathway VirB10-like protein